jgi:hypothetical protein
MASGTDEALHCTGSVLSGNKDDYLNTIIFLVSRQTSRDCPVAY